MHHLSHVMHNLFIDIMQKHTFDFKLENGRMLVFMESSIEGIKLHIIYFTK